MHIGFDKGNEFIRIYGGISYLVLLGPENYYAIYDKIRYLISQENGITYIISHNLERIKIYYYDSLPLVKILTLHNDIILIKSVFNKDQSHHYLIIFSEK